MSPVKGLRSSLSVASTALLPHPLLRLGVGTGFVASLGRRLFAAVARNQLARARFTRAVPWLILLAGIALRLGQYFQDRSLFHDEAFVASNFAHRSFGQLLQPLDFDQRAPAGFLWATKLAHDTLGDSDMSLRLASLLAGILCLFLLYPVAKSYLSPSAVPFALLIFTLAPTQIFFSSELKQYSTDAAACLAILWVGRTIAPGPLTWRQAWSVGLAGGIGCWFSFGMVFLLAGFATCYVVALLVRKNVPTPLRLFLVAALWASGFASIYLLQLRHFGAEPSWKGLWNSAFLSLPPNQWEDFEWLSRKLLELVSTPVGFTCAPLAAVVYLYGLKRLWRTNRWTAACLVAPIPVVLLASGFRIYPFGGRVCLFLAPLVTLTLATGLGALVTERRSDARWVGICLAVMLFSAPLAEAVERSFRGAGMYRNTMFEHWKSQDTKPVMAYIRKHWQPGDHVYLYADSYVAFEYYAERFGFRPGDYSRSIPAGLFSPGWAQTRAALEQELGGRSRVWVFLTHVETRLGVDERRLWLYFLDEFGTRLDEIVMPADSDVSAHLYDFSQCRRTSPPVPEIARQYPLGHDGRTPGR